MMKDFKIKNIAVCLAVLGMLAFYACGDSDSYDVTGNPNNLAYIKINGGSSSGSEPKSLLTFSATKTPDENFNNVDVKFPVWVTKLTNGATISASAVDPLVDKYNAQYNTSYLALPDGLLVFEKNTVTIAQNAYVSSDSIAIKMDNSKVASLEDGKDYLAAVSLSSSSDNSVRVSSNMGIVYLKIQVREGALLFNSLDMSDSGLYSEYHFDKSNPSFTPIALPTYTCEIKIFLAEEEPNRIRRVCNWGGSGSNMLRFGEGGVWKRLQWVYPGGNLFSNKMFSANRWYTVSLTYGDGKYTMYVDGVKDSEKSASGGSFKFSLFELGMSWAGYPEQQKMNGRIAEVRLWSKALNSSEIEQGLCSVDAKSEGLVAYWKMNEGSGAIFHDATGNGYDMDWSDTWREPTESSGYQHFTNKGYSVKWIIDEYNTCN